MWTIWLVFWSDFVARRSSNQPSLWQMQWTPSAKFRQFSLGYRNHSGFPFSYTICSRVLFYEKIILANTTKWRCNHYGNVWESFRNDTNDDGEQYVRFSLKMNTYFWNSYVSVKKCQFIAWITRHSAIDSNEIRVRTCSRCF